LCDEVTNKTDSRQMLERLDRANLFLVRLDDHRGWYRYHRLFADVLQANLRAEHPNHETELHRRASTWFDDQGDPRSAVRHALAANDFEHAADLAGRAVPQ